MIIAGARILGAAPSDIHVSGGVVTAIRPARCRIMPAGGCQSGVVDARGLVALPAFVDLHTHLREPGDEEAETIATGTRSAAAGGYSDVFAMANTRPVTDTAARVEHIRRRASETAHCRVHPVGALSIGLAGRALAPMRAMAAAGATVFSDDGHCLDDAMLMWRALHQAARLGVVVAQHAQHGSLAAFGQINAGHAARRSGLAPWPVVAESTIVARDVMLSADTGGRLHICHVSTRAAVDVIRWAKSRGWPVTAEVTPHHLFLDDEIARQTVDPALKVNPPLRTADDVAAVRAGLIDGTIDAVATDHAPHPSERKAPPWTQAAFGFAGLETALAATAHVLASCDKLDWALVARVMSHAPAAIAGISADAGRPISLGEPATFTLIDPDAGWTVSAEQRYTRSANNPHVGRTFDNRVVGMLLNGRLIHSTINPQRNPREMDNADELCRRAPGA